MFKVRLNQDNFKTRHINFFPLLQISFTKKYKDKKYPNQIRVTGYRPPIITGIQLTLTLVLMGC